MKDYKKIICLTAAVCLLGAAAFCGYHIYDHYAHEAEQTEAFENIAAIVEQAQTEEKNHNADCPKREKDGKNSRQRYGKDYTEIRKNCTGDLKSGNKNRRAYR